MRRLILLLILTLALPLTVSAQDDEGPSIREIARSVVFIGVVQNGEIVANGSGTIVTPTGLIYTNRHVVEDSDDLAIFILEDIQELPQLRYFASTVEVYDQLDFAIIQINRDASGQPIDPDALRLPFLEPQPVGADLGDQVRIFGYPVIGDGYMVVTSGEIVAIQNGNINGERMPVWYRTDTEFSGGNSGGLTVNARGQFVGLPTWVVSEDRTDGKLGGILPITTVLAVINAGSAPPPVAASTTALTIENASETPICFVFISSTTSSSWGDDQLERTEIIAPAGARQWTVEPDYYDVLLADCEGNTLDDIRSLDLFSDQTITLSDGATERVDEVPPSEGSGVSVTCDGGFGFDNGVEILLRGMPATETYTVTVIGIGDFDPVLAVFDTTTGQGTCVDDSPEAMGYSVNLPTTGPVSASERSSSFSFKQMTEVALADVSIVIGGYNNTAGEFLVIVEGTQLTANDQIGDLFAVRLTQGMVDSGTPLTLYMQANTDTLDPVLYLADPQTYSIFMDDTGTPVLCDDAGTQGCYGQSASLTGSTWQSPGGALSFRPTDAMLSLPLLGLTPDPQSPQYFTFGASSIGETTGTYTLFVHAGVR
ncbi:MAG: S1 family peptidase [Chloroflexota bacterium]